MRSSIIGGVASLVLLPLAALAQGAFDVASVRPNTSGAFGRFIEYTADSLRSSNVTLAELIQSAYGIREDRLVGGPDWARSIRFDVTAKAAEALPREQLRRMTQRLLEERFALALTREQRQQEVYALRMARPDGRSGPDLHRAPDDCLQSAADRPIPKSSTGMPPTTHGRCTTINNLATGLSRTLRFEVIDQTGLSGRWDFALAYSGLAADLSAARETAQSDLPTIFVALQEQLGLKLDRNQRGSVEYAVIAAARLPAEN